MFKTRMRIRAGVLSKIVVDLKRKKAEKNKFPSSSITSVIALRNSSVFDYSDGESRASLRRKAVIML